MIEELTRYHGRRTWKNRNGFRAEIIGEISDHFRSVSSESRVRVDDNLEPFEVVALLGKESNSVLVLLGRRLRLLDPQPVNVERS